MNHVRLSKVVCVDCGKPVYRQGRRREPLRPPLCHGCSARRNGQKPKRGGV